MAHKRYVGLIAFGVPAVVTFMVSAAGVAHANDRRTPGSDCLNAGLGGISCPFIDETAFLASSVTLLNANFGVAGNYGAKACVAFWNASGGSCGTSGSSGGTSQVTIPTSTIWSTANTNHFKYIAPSSVPQGFFAHF